MSDVFLFHRRAGYGAMQRMDRLCRFLEEQGGTTRLVAEAEFPDARGKLSALYKLVRKYKRELSRADRIFVFGEIEILALYLCDRGFLQKTCYLQREDNGEKYLYQELPVCSTRAKLKCAGWVMLQKHLLPRLRAMVVQTRYHEAKLRERCGTALPEIKIIGNDIPSEFRQASGGAALSSPLRVGVICGSNPVRKGIDRIRLDKESIDFRLLVASSQMSMVERIAPALMDKRVRRTENGSAVRFLSALDVLLIPSRYDECPNVLLEALGTCTPILCSDIPAHRNLLGDEFSGYVDFEDSPVSISSPHLRPERLASIREQLSFLRAGYLFDWEARMADALNAGGD